MRRTLLLLAAFGVAACNVQRTTDCLPDCDADDQQAFAHCVADGDPGDAAHPECRPGNRACCARAAECIGTLDDQEVRFDGDRSACALETRDECFPPCDEAARDGYDDCLAGADMACPSAAEPELDVCCALAANCLGLLGDVYVNAEGCCVDDLDCDGGAVCDEAFGECILDQPRCGDEIVDADETCDDGNDATETCPYGVDTACTVCAAGCVEGDGVLTYCGDGFVDAAEGEDCEPTASSTTCDATCHTVGADPCSNGVMDGTETDIDCGGDACGGCSTGERCVDASDCEQTLPECASMVLCLTDQRCQEIVSCADTNPCTRDACAPEIGCSFTPIDDDMDGVGPSSLGCGLDCDDADPERAGGFEELCRTLVDEDCDLTVDESACVP